METIHADGPAPASGVAALEAHLGYWLRLVSNHVSGAFARALQEKQTSVGEWVVLSQVRESPEIRPAELADALGLTRGAVSKILDKLEERKWLARKTLQADKRGQRLLVTAQGRRAVPVLTEIADRNDARFFDCLNVKEKAALERLLRKLSDFHQLRDIPIE
jgi:DNA-binding MarR family transcriptional regulator